MGWLIFISFREGNAIPGVLDAVEKTLQSEACLHCELGSVKCEAGVSSYVRLWMENRSFVSNLLDGQRRFFGSDKKCQILVRFTRVLVERIGIPVF